MSDNGPAVYHIVVTTQRFMRLNIEMREAGLTNNRSVWEEKAEEMYSICTNILSNELHADIIAKSTQFHLDTLFKESKGGWMRSDEKENLLSLYQKNKWADFAFREIRSRLACEECVRVWKNYYHIHQKQTWNNKEYRFIAGRASASGGSCNITFVKGWYHSHASHADATNGGMKCSGSERRMHPHYEGLKVRQESDGSWSWSSKKLYKELDILGNYKDYNTLIREIKPNNQFNKEVEIVDYTDTYDNLYGSTYSEKPGLRYTDLILFEAINYYKWENKIHIEYKLHELNSKRAKILPSDSFIERDFPLGLYIFTIHKDLDKDGEMPYFSKLINQEFRRGLQEDLNFPEGDFYKIDSELFTSSEDGEGSTNIDLNDKKMEGLEFVKRIKHRDKDINLPNIKTSLKNLKIYHYFDGKLELLRENQEFSPKHNSQNTKLFCKIGGFSSNAVDITLSIFRIERNEKEVKKIGRFTKIFNQKSCDFFTCIIPNEFSRNRKYRIELTIDDGSEHGQGRLNKSIIATGNTYQQSDKFKAADIDFGIESNKEILIKNIKLNLEKHHNPEEKYLDWVLDPNGIKYSEIIKLELGGSTRGTETFTPPSKRISNRYPGVTELAFPNRADDVAKKSLLSSRIRAMGILTSTTNNNDADLQQDSRLWACYDPHIVKLSKSYSILITPNTLLDHRIEPSNHIWTNHGTIIKGQIPSNLSGVRKVTEPLFLHHIAESAAKHFQNIGHIIDKLGQNIRSKIKQKLSDYFEVTYSLHPSHETLVNRYSSPKSDSPQWRRQWEQTVTRNISSLPISPFAIKVECDNKLVAMDILYLERETGDEDLIVIRRSHNTGECDYLPISRIIYDTENRPRPSQLEWVGKIRSSSISELTEFFEIIGGKYQMKNWIRAHDWDYILTETLRAISSINGYKSTDSTGIENYRRTHAQSWPEPLRKFCMGGGRYLRDKKYNSDPMGGILNNEEVNKDPRLREDLLDAISRWTWFS